MILKQIDKSEVYRIPTTKLEKLPEQDKHQIEVSRLQYVMTEETNTSFLNFPGSCFSEERAMKGFEYFLIKDYVKQCCHNLPHGNLTSSNTLLMYGYQPEHSFDKNYLNVKRNFWSCTGDFGNWNSLILKFFKDLNIYPFISNIYNFRLHKEEQDIQPCIYEIKTLANMYLQVYKQKSLDILFFGNYDEYYAIVRNLKKQEKELLKKISLNFYRIWHPSYLIKEYTDEKFVMWKKQFVKKFYKVF